MIFFINLRTILFQVSLKNHPRYIKSVPAGRVTFRDPRPRFTPTGPRQLAYTTLRFCFSCSLTRRANRTRRGYRWPTSEPISYSSKRPYSLSTIPVGRHEHHYHHPPPLLPSPTTTITTIQEQQHRHHQQSAPTIYTRQPTQLFASGLSDSCYSFVVLFIRVYKKKKKDIKLDENKLKRNILNVAKILNPKLDLVNIVKKKKKIRNSVFLLIRIVFFFFLL